MTELTALLLEESDASAVLIAMSGALEPTANSPDTLILLGELALAAATAAGLFAVILMFGPVSGAHFNPVVSLVDAAFGGISWRDTMLYVPAQIGGCVCGAMLANLMWARDAISLSTKHRASPEHFVAEIVATSGLLLVIFSLARSGRSSTAPAAVTSRMPAEPVNPVR